MAESGLITNHAHRFAPAALDEDIVHGACAPGWHSAAEHGTALSKWISFMQDAGIGRVCCLVPGRHLTEAGANVARYRQAFGRENVCHAPIPQNRLVSTERFHEEILPFLQKSTERDVPVVVHDGFDLPYSAVAFGLTPPVGHRKEIVRPDALVSRPLITVRDERKRGDLGTNCIE